jgi:hypothetical protein
MTSSISQENLDNTLSNGREAADNWTAFFNPGAGTAWSFPSTAGTSRAAEHALETCRTVCRANQAAIEALYNTARRQQEVTFRLGRTTLDAWSSGMLNGAAQQPNAPWMRAMAGYAEAYHAGLEVTQAMTDAAFRALQRAPAMLAHGSTDKTSAS